MAVTVVVTYDIREDATRARVAALLQAYGDRVQRSVFLLTVADTELVSIQERLMKLIDEREDSVYVFHQCIPCWDAKTCLGQAHPPEPVLYWSAL